jgi:hypothetical protein
MKRTIILFAAAASLGLAACNSANMQGSSSGGASNSGAMEKNGLKVYSFNDSPKFPDAQLQLLEPGAGAAVPAGEVNFNYQLANYELTAQTEGPAHQDHANSAQGQHIHNIVDNEPYTAHYTTIFTKPIKEGSHVVLSFLSRSYHESLKHKSAYDLRVVNVGDNTTGPGENFNTNGQHLFYSRPKGEYVGNDTKKVMLDFYLVNTDLAPNGNKVRAIINGNEFMLNRWLPYTIEGLPMGENTIRLELVDKNGNVIPGPFNTVERKITLKASS